MVLCGLLLYRLSHVSHASSASHALYLALHLRPYALACAHCWAEFLYAVCGHVYDDFGHVYAVFVQLCEDGVQHLKPMA